MTDLNFGLKIRQLIKQQKITIQEAANMMGYTRQGFTDVLEKDDVNTAVLKKICDVFGVDMDYFLGGDMLSIRQEGNANIAGNHNKHHGGNNSIGGNSNRLEILENENVHLKKQVQLLEQMVEVLRIKN